MTKHNPKQAKPFKVGDEVVVIDGYGHPLYMTRIARVLQRFVETERFNNKWTPQGRRYPRTKNYFSPDPHIEHVTPARRAVVERREAIAALQTFAGPHNAWADIRTEGLRQAVEVMTEFKRVVSEGADYGRR